MPEFKVRRYNMAIWDGREPQTVLAPSGGEAGERAAGQRLSAHGPHGKLRAEVWPTGFPQRKETYYSI
jgi:hypothetical protein